jgi:Rrf2 family protein
MLFSPSISYALHVLTELHEDEGFHPVRELAARHDAPGPYLAKILQSLAHAGILESLRGPRGGFRLARAAHHISIQEIINALHGGDPLDTCALGLHACDEQHPCPMHPIWVEIKPLIHESLGRTTLRDLQVLKRFPVEKEVGHVLEAHLLKDPLLPEILKKAGRKPKAAARTSDQTVGEGIP